jgi:hypothetical protein
MGSYSYCCKETLQTNASAVNGRKIKSVGGGLQRTYSPFEDCLLYAKAAVLAPNERRRAIVRLFGFGAICEKICIRDCNLINKGWSSFASPSLPQIENLFPACEKSFSLFPMTECSDAPEVT